MTPPTLITVVEAHTDARWVVLRIKRWLVAGLRAPEDSTAQRTRGTPHDSAVSPVFASLILQFAFDTGMDRVFPDGKWSQSSHPCAALIWAEVEHANAYLSFGPAELLACVTEHGELAADLVESVVARPLVRHQPSAP